MHKLILGLALFLMVNLVAAPSFVTETDTDWDQGNYLENTTSENGFLEMPIFGPEIDWRIDSYDNRLEDVEKYEESSDFVFVGGKDDGGDQSVWKYDEDGNREWKWDRTTGTVWSLAVGEDYVYAGTSENIVVKIDKSDGSEEDVFNFLTETPRSMKLKNGFLFVGELSGSNSRVRKIDPTNGNIEWTTNINNDVSAYVGSYELGVSDSGQVFAGGNRLVKLDTDGSYIKHVFPVRGVYHGVEVGSDDYIYAGGGEGFRGNDGFIQKYDLSLDNEIWLYEPESRVFDIDLDTSNNVYGATTFDDDRTYKISDTGNFMWVKEDPESQLGVESHSNGAYSVGLLNDNPDGISTRFIEVYPDIGEYSSKEYGSSGIKYWETLDLTTQLDGQDADVDVVFSNSSGFSSTSTQTFNDISEDAVLDLNDEPAEYARVDLTLSTGDEVVTPRIDSFSLDYSTNLAPQIDSYSPNDGYIADKDANEQTLSVDVSDPNGDTMYVSFYDDGGNQIETTKTVSGGSGSASVDYDGLSEGNRYDWSVEVSDSIDTTGETHYFETASDQLPVIDNNDPLNGTEFTPGEVDVSVDVEDPDNDNTVVEIYNESSPGDPMSSKILSNGGPENVNATYKPSDYGERYVWEVVAYRNGEPSKKTTKTYYFETSSNPAPVVEDYYPDNGTKFRPGDDLKLNVTVNDSNDDPMTVTFYDANKNKQIKSPQTVNGGSGVAEVDYSVQGNGKEFDWYVEIDDGSNLVTKYYNYNSLDDTPPQLSKASPKDNVTITASPADLSVLVEDDFASDIDIRFEDDNGDEIKDYTIGEGEYANASYPVMKDETTYNWTVIAEDDISQTNSSEFQFYYDRPPFQPVQASIESNYTDIIMTESSSTVVPFKITNPSAKKNLSITIDGNVNANFVDGGTSKQIIMNQGTETFLVQVSPDSPGQKELSLSVENRQYGTFTTDTKNVFVEESSSSYEQVNVPGIGIVQIYSLLMISTLAYFALL